LHLFSCKGALQIQQISFQLPIQYQIRINDELLQAYLSNQQDVRRRPRKNCSYAGIITPKPCCKNLQCGLCSAIWTDKLEQTEGQKALNFFKGFYSVKTRSFLSFGNLHLAKSVHIASQQLPKMKDVTILHASNVVLDSAGDVLQDTQPIT